MMLTELLNQKDKFSDMEQSVAQYFLNCNDDVTQLSARYVAKELYVSPSTVTRFTQKLGFPGYMEFVRSLQEEKEYLNTHFQKIDPNFPFEQNDTNYQVAGKISKLYDETVDDTMELIDYVQLEKATQLLQKAQIIHLVSSGTSISLGEIFKDKMAKIGKRVIVSQFVDVSFSYAYQPLENEVFILISYSGQTEQILKVASQLKENKKSFIAITSYGHNELSTYTDCVLNVSTREKLKSGVGSYGIHISTMYLLDVLYSCVFRTHYDKNLDLRYKISKKFQDKRHSDNPILKDEGE